jgi:hypothetical protein
MTNWLGSRPYHPESNNMAALDLALRECRAQSWCRLHDSSGPHPLGRLDPNHAATVDPPCGKAWLRAIASLEWAPADRQSWVLSGWLTWYVYLTHSTDNGPWAHCRWWGTTRALSVAGTTIEDHGMGGGALRLHTQAMSPELTFSEYSFCLQIIVAIAFLSYIWSFILFKKIKICHIFWYNLFYY